MMDFTSFVDTEVQKALPSICKRIDSNKLLARGPIRIRHAFQTLPVNGKSKLANILVLPPELDVTEELGKQIIQLQDYILSKDCLLIIIHQEDSPETLGYTGGFVEDYIALNHPNVLWLRCIVNQHYKTSVIYDQFEELHAILHDVWNGSLHYKGPLPGNQQVNLELMSDRCWKCKKEMKTVTGIVFPDRQLPQWDNSDWLYYNQLVPLSKIEGNNAQIIYEFVEKLRTKDRHVTPVGERYSHTVKVSYIAASCPHCKALRGDFHVNDYRMQYLHSLHSRLTGELQYYSITLHIDQEILDELANGYEGCDHTTGPGWER